MEILDGASRMRGQGLTAALPPPPSTHTPALSARCIARTPARHVHPAATKVLDTIVLGVMLQNIADNASTVQREQCEATSQSHHSHSTIPAQP